MVHRILVLLVALVAGLACVQDTQAQYVSEGWKPGQPKEDGLFQDVKETVQSALPYVKSSQPGADVPTQADIEAEELAKLDAQHEGLPERIMRTLLIYAMGHNHTTVSAHRRTVHSAVHPDLHPRIETFQVKESWEVDGISIDSQIVRSLRFPLGRNIAKPWVVLVASPSNEKTSREIVKNFNEALEAIYPTNSTESDANTTEEPSIFEATDSDESFDLLPDYSILEKREASKKAEPTPDDAEKERRQLARIAQKARTKVEGWNFAYVDFQEQPHIVWRWWIWKIPVIVFVTPSTSPTRTYDLRYWSIAWSKPSATKIAAVISDEQRWKQLPVWDASHAPGGHNAVYVHRAADASQRIYKILDPIPSWVLMLASTIFATQIISIMHIFFPDKPVDASAIPNKDKVARAVAKTKERAEVTAKKVIGAAKADEDGQDERNGVRITRSGRKSIPKKR